MENTIQTLNLVRKRMSSFINPLNLDTLKCFFDGFYIGNISARNNLEFSDYTNAWIESVKFRGWKANALGVQKELEEKGLSEKEIIQELFEIEIKTWELLEAKFDK